MTFTYVATDVSTDLAKVRLTIGDTDSANALFSDEELAAFLSMNGDAVLLAAARALDTIAANQVLVLKVIQSLDLQTDGASVGRELRLQAAGLRKQHEDALEAADDGDGLFDWAELVTGPFSARERLLNQALRT